MKKNGYLSALIGLFTIIGLAGVTSCVSEGPTAPSYYGYIPLGAAAYQVHELGSGQRITMDQVEVLAKDYLHDLNDPNLRAREIIEFEYDFYVRFSEKDSGINAFAALVNPYNGMMYPGHHPDKFWNTKYKGEPRDLPSGPMTITQEQAWNDAQRFIDVHLPGRIAGTVEPFYGYYTVPVLTQGYDVAGLLSINGYSGAVCYEACHGLLIGRKELR